MSTGPSSSRPVVARLSVRSTRTIRFESPPRRLCVSEASTTEPWTSGRCRSQQEGEHVSGACRKAIRLGARRSAIGALRLEDSGTRGARGARGTSSEAEDELGGSGARAGSWQLEAGLRRQAVDDGAPGAGGGRRVGLERCAAEQRLAVGGRIRPDRLHGQLQTDASHFNLERGWQ